MTVFDIYYAYIHKKLSWCWQTRATRLEVSQSHQTRHHSICWVWLPISVQ